MKTKLIPNLSMKLKKSIYVSGALLAGIVVCMSVFFGLREHKERELQGKSNFTLQNNGIAAAPLTMPRGNSEEELQTPAERIVQHTKNNFVSLYSEDELATQERQKMLEVMNSPEYLKYMKNALEKGYRFRHSAEFWESHGFPLERDMFKDAFRKEFPTGVPEMRLKMANLFLSQEPVDLTNPSAAALQRQEVFLKFIKEEGRNIGWLGGQFGIDLDGAMLAGWEEGSESTPAFVWITDVQRHAASIVAAAETTGVDTPEAQVSAPSWDMSSVMESPSASDSEMSVPLPPLDTSTDAEIEAATRPQPLDMPQNHRPDMPGEIQSNLEASLKSQFSPEQFDRAMSTLEQYGPEEGLRRLRQSDPDFAKQVEQHRNREEVSK